MKLCKDCKHCDRYWGVEPRCGLTGGLDPVDGGIKRPEFSCRVERRYDFKNSCGPDGKFFVPIKPEPVEVLDNHPAIKQNWSLQLINLLKGNRK